MVFATRDINAVRKAQKKYREKRRPELAEKAKEIRERKIAQFQKAGVERRKERSEMLNIIRVIAFTVSRTDLTDSEKVMQICKVPISDELTPYLKQRSKEVTA